MEGRKKSIEQIKQKCFFIITITISLIFFFVVSEMIVRVFHLSIPIDTQYKEFVYDPYLPYKPRPFSVVSGRSSTEEFDYEYRHNSFGFRDVEHSLTKDQGVFRILGIGDSFTYGAGATYEGTYLSQLETMLNNRQGKHPKCEIIKAGISRYFPEAERMLLEHYGVAYSPDLILVGFVPNDIVDTYMGIDSVKVDKSGFLKTVEAEKLGSMGLFFYIHSHFCRFLLRKYLDYKLNQTYQLRWHDIYKENGFHEKDWQKVEYEYTRMISIARHHNADIVFIHIPQKGPWTEEHFYPPKRLSQWCTKNGIGFVDTLPAIIEYSKEFPLYYEKDGHCRPEGYAVIAEKLYQYLIEETRVP
jgi:hypothetical protein